MRFGETCFLELLVFKRKSPRLLSLSFKGSVGHVLCGDRLPGPGSPAPLLSLRLPEELQNISGEGLPNLDTEGPVGDAPEHNLGLPQHGACAHPEGERRGIEVQGTSGVEKECRARAGDLEPDMPMADIDERMREPRERPA